ncbi:hypothetical protein GCM10008934_33310 [Virgibacillus salarius]
MPGFYFYRLDHADNEVIGLLIMYEIILRNLSNHSIESVENWVINNEICFWITTYY